MEKGKVLWMALSGVWGALEYNNMPHRRRHFRQPTGNPESALRRLPKDGLVLIEKQHFGGGTLDEFTARLDPQLC